MPLVQGASCLSRLTPGERLWRSSVHMRKAAESRHVGASQLACRALRRVALETGDMRLRPSGDGREHNPHLHRRATATHQLLVPPLLRLRLGGDQG